MITKIKGRASMTKMMKKLRGGPSSVLPLSPGKGTGVKSLGGLTPKKMRKYSAPKQNPARTPRTGGLTRPSRMR